MVYVFYADIRETQEHMNGSYLLLMAMERTECGRTRGNKAWLVGEECAHGAIPYLGRQDKSG